MKYLTPTLLMAIFVTLFGCHTYSAVAQTFKGEQDFTISYGLVSGRQIGDYLSVDEDGGGIYETAHTGNFFFTYRYFITENSAIGITGGFQNISGTINADGGTYGYVTDIYKIRNNTLAAEYMHVYTSEKYYTIYLLAGIGVSKATLLSNDVVGSGSSNVLGNTSQPGTNTRFNFQFDPFGITVGGKVSGFLEIGIGYKGLLNTGILYRLGKMKKQQHHSLFDRYKEEPGLK